MDSDFVPPSEILERFPSLSRSTLKYWAISCPMLGRAVRTIEDESHKGYRLYSLSDVAEAMQERSDAPLPDEYTDDRDHWIWVNLLPDKHKFSLTSIDKWQVACPGLNGAALEIATKRGGGHSHVRQYMRERDIKQILAFRDQPPLEEREWLNYETAEKLGFDRGFLIKFSSSGDARRTKIGKPHPALKATIKTDRRRVVVKGRTVWQVRFWRSDLLKILGYVEKEMWATREQARAEYNLTDSELQYAQEYGSLSVRKFPIVPTHGKPSEILHFLRSQLVDLSKKVIARKGIPRPGLVERSHVDAEGTWWPQREAIKLSGAKAISLKLWRDGCPHLHGRPIRSQQVKLQLFRTKHGDQAWVYHGDDLTEIRCRIEGRPFVPPTPIPTPTARVKGSRKGVGGPKGLLAKDAAFRLKVLADWERASPYCPRKVFCAESGVKYGKKITPADIEKFQSWRSTQ